MNIYKCKDCGNELNSFISKDYYSKGKRLFHPCIVCGWSKDSVIETEISIKSEKKGHLEGVIGNIDLSEKSEWEELTVGDVQRWLDKLDRIQSKGAKVVHVKHLLESEKKKSALEALERVEADIYKRSRDDRDIGYLNGLLEIKLLINQELRPEYEKEERTP